MTDCMDNDIREILPDLLHGTLPAATTARVEAHLATCETCREELDVLRTVKAAAVFAPSIDANRIGRQIPPYRTIVPAIERPQRPRIVSWLVAACLAVVIAGGGSVLVMQRDPDASARIASNRPQSPAVLPTPNLANTAEVAVVESPAPSAPGARRTHSLALAVGVEGLSDGDLQRLMTDMNGFDALPSPEPEAVIAVDNGDATEQDSR